MKINIKKIIIVCLIVVLSIFSFGINTNAKGFDNDDFYKKNGWFFPKDVSRWVYYENDQLKIGWLNDRGAWYYFGEDGIMAKGIQCINNNWYYFYEDGVMAHDTTLDGCVFNSNGVLIQTKAY